MHLVPSGATQKSADKFAGGEVAWLLNGSKDNGTWKQTIGTDSYPNFSGGAVYKSAPCESYTNNKAEKSKEHNYNDSNCCTGCGKLKLNADGYYEIDTVEKFSALPKV